MAPSGDVWVTGGASGRMVCSPVIDWVRPAGQGFAPSYPQFPQGRTPCPQSLSVSPAPAPRSREEAGITYEFPCRMITLEVHSSLEAVGFIARIATALANEGMGVNPVAGFYHDHLFVPVGREQDALDVLSRLAGEGVRR